MTETNWKRSLGAYARKDLTVLTFSTETEIDRAIDFLWGDEELRSVPRDYLDGKTMLAPNELSQILKSGEFKFKESKLVSLESLSYNDLAERRQMYGM